ncbi:PPK2 family polyphosphate kinase [Microbacterium sp. Marseille-Q6648]|jgi:PPK2 family polyphosphate:nucleotide phosphotransferase|uniref:PPK2 family polyphosphate kinase n=1 Tax=Microbacterium sp. Marseille-Q6648 TaxID=2937991 RepID=UPI00203EAD7E|nr:PPK2 family polyphosphate kinase [Microbacterium sp. Marseille-Q6648]
MGTKEQKRWTADVSRLLRVGEDFILSGVDPSGSPGYEGAKADAVADLERVAGELEEYQDRLYAASQAETTHAAVLLVLQAMDGAGKSGIIRHVVGAVDPQGIQISAFKKPTEEELEHDFLWRIKKRIPEPGVIGVFDRSHYEDVLVGKVREFATPKEIERRYDAINDFEKKLVESGTRIVKVMLHISYEEQRDRLMKRLDRPDKHWKYNPGDTEERKLWPHYMSAFQTVFDRTSTDAAPWYVVPANHKWYARLAVQGLLLEALEDIDPRWPAADYDVAEEKRKLAAT